MKFERRIGYLFALLIVLLSVRCTGPDGGPNDTLALQDYRYVEVAAVNVTATTRYDPDKLGLTISRGLQTLIDQSQFWCKGKSPKALVEVEITNFHEPSKAAQFGGVDGYKIAYIIRARDAVSAEPLGEASGVTKLRLTGGILGSGLAGAFADLQFEQGWDNTTRQSTINYHIINGLAKKIDRAKERGRSEPRPIIAPEPPKLAKGVQVAASVVQK